ncbi:LOW QUALITY PROTEIN: Ribonuclease H-like domain containing protein [Trema orientale]|uniref:Ribonuclease H-like domain containing protein n=1 Tax=Trema orientale TaxID=63057 RepID=A0A2P5EC30_TREOI|nr:LOW QUALITY PROTEIN: Ribonuclease H-like domain containing protein [Trema orientale]
MDVVCILLWAMWNRRNNLLYNGVLKDIMDTFDSACLFLLEYESSSKLTVSSPNIALSSSSHWSRPRVGGLKLNTDAAFPTGENFIRCGGVIRDEHGSVLVCWAIRVVGCFNVEVGELIAIREGLRLAVEFGCPLAEIEIDLLIAVHSISNPQLCSAVGLLVRDISLLISSAGIILVAMSLEIEIWWPINLRPMQLFLLLIKYEMMHVHILFLNLKLQTYSNMNLFSFKKKYC